LLKLLRTWLLHAGQHSQCAKLQQVGDSAILLPFPQYQQHNSTQAERVTAEGPMQLAKAYLSQNPQCLAAHKEFTLKMSGL